MAGRVILTGLWIAGRCARYVHRFRNEAWTRRRAPGHRVVVVTSANGVRVMDRIDVARARLGRAGGLAAALAAGWDAFELLASMADECADRADALFAAFMMAMAAAADGRDALAAAPSLPPEPEVEAEAEAEVPGDVAQVAAELAGLASDLTACLSAAAQAATGITDRAACERAAREACRIHDLLAGDR